MKKNKLSWGFSVALAGLLALAAPPASASSHREAPSTLNDPCIDNTDLYAWVTPGSHDKLYLIAGYAGLHEPGQGNQQAHLCDDVLYEFHIARGIDELKDDLTYQIQFSSTPAHSDPRGAGCTDKIQNCGNELLIQLSGIKQTYTVTKVENRVSTVIGTNLPVAPPNVGPHTDRLVYGLGVFKGFQENDPTSHEIGLYDDAFAATFISPLGTAGADGRAWMGTRDDAFYLDEKGIFDIFNLAGLPGGRTSPGEDVFAGFNLNVIALEVPTSKVTGTGLPPAHNGTPGDDTLIGVWASASRQKRRTLDTKLDDGIQDKRRGKWVQVGREGLPLINAGVIGVQDQDLYLRTTPLTDFVNFGAYFLNPVIVRDLEALGAYAALTVPQATIDQLKTNRMDILKVINLDDIPTPGAHHVPREAGKTGDVLRLDIATDSGFPNGRMIPNGAAPNKEHADVSDVLITLIASGGAIPLGDSVNSNDKNYLTEFPFLALPHQGVNGGHGATAP